MSSPVVIRIDKFTLQLLVAISNAVTGRKPHKRREPKVVVSESTSTLNRAAHHDSSHGNPALPLSLFSFPNGMTFFGQDSSSGASTPTSTMANIISTHSSTETIIDTTPTTWYFRCCACMNHASETRPGPQTFSLPAWFSNLEAWQQDLSLVKYLADKEKSVQCSSCLHPICRHCTLSTSKN
ncbi:hypothetical protein B0H67DRAFT_638827 [Lasiosphaeris hirsuta]|uniref:Uncharacterized protein n=1 Tax=Lasiosphaeris hirsuta TaxID=260670 RepID=A0AA40E9S6_9PEZI|nr:hypothetical protein B0H67DRAFT_638827 [Lasiosphaeris hirsuta]